VIHCKSCNSQIQSDAAFCNRCGARSGLATLANKSGRKGLWIILGSVAVAIVLIAGAGSTQSTGTEEFHTGNKANDLMLGLPEPQQLQALDMSVNSAGYICKGQEAFYAGISSGDQTAYWSVRCSNGESYQVQFAPNSTGSTKVLDCHLMNVLGQSNCFAKLRDRTGTY
jgi:hypothetical protein